MRKIERFLNSNIYPLLIAVIAFVAWFLPVEFEWVNNALIIALLLLFVLILAVFENTKYIIPIIISLMFTINVQNIGLEDIEGISVYHIMLGLSLLGLIVHFLRFKHKVKIDLIAIGFLLIGISYFIPMAYMPFNMATFSVSLTGILYFLFYIFFLSTSKVKTEEVLNYFFIASLQLLAILSYSIGTSFYNLILENNLTETIKEGLKTGWGGTDFGFGNINDLTIHFAILSSGIFYKVIKKPNNYLYWFIVILGITNIVLSGSRGGILTLILILIVYYIMLIKHGKKHQIITVNILILAFVGFMVLNKEISLILYDNFIQGGFDDIDRFSSGRIKLYKEALEVFKQYPIAGAGWTVIETNNVDRLQVFHSTIFHTLAITGLIGLISVIIFTFASFKTIYDKRNLNVLILAVPWIMTMIHGLIDNTVHMVIFTVLTIIMFTGIQRDYEGSNPRFESLFMI